MALPHRLDGSIAYPMGGRPPRPLNAGPRTTSAELAGLALDLPEVDPDEAWRRLGRLAEEQCALVIQALEETVRVVEEESLSPGL